MKHLGNVALTAAFILLTSGAQTTQAQGPVNGPERFEPVVISPDAREFLNSCASCHGDDGKGAGFLTRLFRGVDPGDLTQWALPDVAVPDDQQLIKATTAEGVPFVLAQPKAKASQAIMEVVQRLTAQPDPAGAGTAAAPPVAQTPR